MTERTYKKDLDVINVVSINILFLKFQKNKESCILNNIFNTFLFSGFEKNYQRNQIQKAIVL